jgi:Tfp pilus assembly protein PilF
MAGFNCLFECLVIIFSSRNIRSEFSHIEIAVGKSRWGDGQSERYLDSAFTIANKALSHDKTVSEAYRVKALYYDIIGDSESADRELDTGSDMHYG